MHPTHWLISTQVTAVLYLCGPAWDEPAGSGDDGALVLYCGADAADDDGDSATAVHRVRPVGCLLYTSPSPRDGLLSRMPSSA